MGRRGRVLLGLAAIFAFVWRVFVLERLARGPLLDSLLADSASYWQWAKEIRSGAAGHNPWFLGALEPYLVALAQSFVGESIHRVLLVQSALGALTIAILADVVRRLAGPRWAVFAALLLGGYGMFVFFDVQVLMETPLLFLESLFLWCVVRMEDSERRSGLVLIAAACVAVASFGRPSELLLLGVLLLAIQRHAGSARLAALAVAVALLGAVPGTLHHWKTERAFIPYTYSLGFNAYMGNGPEASGTFVPFTRGYSERSLDTPNLEEGGGSGDGRSYLLDAFGLKTTAEQSSRVWLGRTFDEVRRHPARALALLGGKLAMAVNRHELPQVAGSSAYERSAGVPLGWPSGPVWLLVGALGLCALPWAFRGRTSPLAWMLVLSWIGIALVFVVDRYRVHLLVPMVPLAAWSAQQAWTFFRQRNWRALLPRAAAWAVALVLVCLPVVPQSAAHERWSVATMLGGAWLAKEQPARALPYLEEAVAIDARGELPQADRPGALPIRARAYAELGLARQLLGDDAGALKAFRTAADLVPNAGGVQLLLGDAAASAGDVEAARSAFARAGLSPQDGAARLVQLARTEAARGRDAAAANDLRAASLLAPAYEPAVIPYIRMQIVAGALDGAAATLAHAEANGLDPNLVLVHRAWIERQRGRSPAPWLARIPEAVKRTNPIVRATLDMMAAQR